MTVLARSALRPDGVRDTTSAFETDVIEGLTATPKRIPAKYFYDAAGSELFQQITELPEYYPTRTELQILTTQRQQIGALLPTGAALIEFGSGSTEKARIVLQAAAFAVYVPVDISGDFLAEEVTRLKRDMPQLVILPVAGDFVDPFVLPAEARSRPRVGFFPGSTIGNFEPFQACAFLRHIAGVLGAGATLIVGVDLVKDPETLFKAYNDSQGITARFNRNMLARMNRELCANFDACAFEHHAFYNRELSRIEMHLASRKRQKVRVAGRTIELRAGETIHTENSYKYTIETFAALAQGAGWVSRAVFTDPRHYFSIHVLVPEPAAPRPRAGDGASRAHS
jgi:dimethylhistidine N-methyltransferase